MRLGLGPSQGHTGFDKIVTGKDSKVEIGIYNHYLHHKYFEVNYSDGIIPLDKWFGSFHDGSVEADKEIEKLNINQLTKPIQTSSGYLIIKLNNKREKEKELDFEKTFKQMITEEKNRQLNQFSLIYFNKIKQNIFISEK